MAGLARQGHLLLASPKRRQKARPTYVSAGFLHGQVSLAKDRLTRSATSRPCFVRRTLASQAHSPDHSKPRASRWAI